jgi:hypothetical protein
MSRMRKTTVWPGVPPTAPLSVYFWRLSLDFLGLVFRMEVTMPSLVWASVSGMEVVFDSLIFLAVLIV